MLPTKPQLQTESLQSLKQINLNAAGIDIGADNHWVSVPADRDTQCVRRFGCFTAELYALADWLAKCGVNTVAMESTGVYWIPVFQILEARGFEVKLVNAHYVKTVPGRKSDVLDCQWLQQLHTYGLLSGSFRPDDQICVLRSYIRQRDNLIRSSTTHVLRMQKALTEMNIQLHRVITDITGTTGLTIIRAIIAGEHNPQKLASLKDCRIKSSTEQIAAALTGDYRAEQLFILQQELHLWEVYQSQIASCDEKIEQCLAAFDSKVDVSAKPLSKPKQRGIKPRGNSPAFDLRTHLYRISGVDFTRIDGFGVLTVQAILSEVGLDPSRFPTVKHFTSWLGLCPGSRITGGKVKSSQTRPVINRAAHAFRMAAQSLRNSRTALGAFYRRLRARCGTPKAITATAHKLARIFYHLWTTGGEYADPGVDYYEHKYHERMVNQLKKKAQSLGFELVAPPSVTECVS
ncbi:transposase [Scytonema hofmannii PCC 7110]|uniref:Transposase n=1 Tax=Scytonema hofmannii PCC 7110 TaxID=128403 RepID=A0A139X6K0_9CYAN|nr:IS110 family transposase [Scytonema hofmannii]KYC40339.1 transposase [Scytonema hofmannii PCC 7110]